jgi:AraC-like DNA-binding protein
MMPYRIDLFAIFIFLGIVQAAFLSVFFFSKENRKIQANIFYGILFISMAACNLEILLMYTGYIVNALHLVDFSEPIAFLIGPSFYLMIRALRHGKVRKVEYLHFAFAVFYFLLVVPFYLQSEDVKYNSWVESYALDLPYRDAHLHNDPRVFWITDHHTLLTLSSIIMYSILSLIEVIKAFREKKESFFATRLPILKNFRAGTIQISVTIILTLIIKALHPNDTGDHIFAAYMAVAIYITSFRVMRSSGFFKPASLAETERYKNSLLPSDQQQELLAKLEALMAKEKPYLQSDVSLPELAEKLGTTVHVLSQAINGGLGKSFFEMIATYRVQEAKTLLIKQKNIKVEEIAEQVGYNSKSSFNTAFKKVTGLTPSEFRNSQ